MAKITQQQTEPAVDQELLDRYAIAILQGHVARQGAFPRASDGVAEAIYRSAAVMVAARKLYLETHHG